MAYSVENVEHDKVAMPSRNVDCKILDAFWKLVETENQVRLNASVFIIDALSQKQEEIQEKNTEQSPELSYCVNRLVKGIGSSRKAARQGYTLVLTEVLKLFPAISVEEVLQLVEKHLPITNKQEKCNMVIGRLLTYSAVIRSGRLKDDALHLPVVVMSLYKLSQSRYYIQQASQRLMEDLFSQLNGLQFKDHLWINLKNELSCGWATCTPHILWLLLLCQRMFPRTVTAKFLKKHWKSEDIFCNINLEYVKNIIKQSTISHPQIHPVCSELLMKMLQAENVQEIWKLVIDENLFSSSKDKKIYLGFQFIKMAMCKVSKWELVQRFLSPKFSSAFTRHLLNSRHPLNAASLELAEFFCNYMKETQDPELQIVVLKAILQLHGAVLLEQIVKKKIIVTLISCLCADAVKTFFEMLKFVVLLKKQQRIGEDEDFEDKKRCQAAQQIGPLLSHPAVVSDIGWRTDVMKFLLLHSFFLIKRPTKTLPQCESVPESMPDIVREACMNSFIKATDSLGRKSDDSISPLQQRCRVLQSLSDYANLLLQSPDYVTPLISVDIIQEPWELVQKTVHKLHKQNRKDGKLVESSAFQILFLQLGLQLFSDPKHIISVLKELEICCKQALEARKHEMLEGKEAANFSWVQVMMDLLLSFLSQPSRHMRCVANSVFSLLCPFITQEALQPILDVIDVSKGVEDLLEDVNEKCGEEKKAKNVSGSSPENEKEIETDLDVEMWENAQKVLTPDADVDDADLDAALTDADMARLDDALTEAFRSRRKMGHSKLNSEEQVFLCFRLRCLDLISTYFKTEPPMFLVLHCVLPLLSAIEHGLQNQQQHHLADKAISALDCLMKVKKFQHIEEIQVNVLEKLLQQVIVKANRATNSVMREKLNSLCIYLVLCNKKLDSHADNTGSNAEECEKPKYMEEYLIALDQFVTQNNSHLLPQMFTSLMNACPETAWTFWNPLQNYAFNPSVRMFKKTQCLGLLLAVLKFSKAQPSVTPEKWLQLSNSVIPKVIEALKMIISGTDINTLYTTELLDILVTINELIKEKNNIIVLENNIDLLSVLENMNSSQRKRLKHRGNHLWKKLIVLLGGKLPSSEQTQNNRKRKLEEGNEIVDVDFTENLNENSSESTGEES